MKAVSTFTALAVLGLGPILGAQASAIHLDIAVDVQMGEEVAGPDYQHNSAGAAKVFGKPRSKVYSMSAHKAGTHVTNEYDIKLPYEIERGNVSENGKYIKFSNIPYAKPPYGDLRFKSPQPITDEGSEVNDGTDRRVCPQIPAGWGPKALEFLECYAGSFEGKCSFKNNWTEEIGPEDYPNWLEKLPGDLPMSEDCLLLDVSVPKSVWESKDKKKAPVVVWIHGGGYIFGWKEQLVNEQPLFEAAEAANDGQNIIYVSINYRLGMFGWLGGPDFVSDGGDANVGLMDQKLALAWVRQHIHLWGGDKDSVTVMGESAGASSILHHLTSYGGDEKHKPNFTRAIVQSPAFFPEGDVFQTNRVYNEVRSRAGVRGGTLSQLQRKSGLELMITNAITTYYSQYGLFRFGPSVDHPAYHQADNTFVPELPGVLLHQGKYHKGIDLLLGHTSLDGLIFTPPWLRTNDAVNEYMTYLYPDMSYNDSALSNITALYKIDDKLNENLKIGIVMDLLDDVAVQCNNYYLTEAVLRDTPETKVYRYLFGAPPAIHGTDLYYTYFPTTPAAPVKVDGGLAQFMQRAWVSFVKTGEPTYSDKQLVRWPRYRTDAGAALKRMVMNLGSLVSYAPLVGADPMGEKKRERCAFWQGAPFRDNEELVRGAGAGEHGEDRLMVQKLGKL